MQRDGNAGCLRFFGFNPRGNGKEGEVERSMVWLTRVDAWLVFVVGSLTEQESGGGQQQNLYADKQRRMLELAMVQLTGNKQVLGGTGRG